MLRCSQSFSKLVALGVAMVGLGANAAQAEGLGFFDPTPTVLDSFTFPSSNLFEGPFVGVDFNLQANNFLTFYSAGDRHRWAAGVIGGHNWALPNGAVVGVEGRIEGTYDAWTPGNPLGYNVYALSHLGFLTAEDFLIFNTLALGWIDGSPAWGFGVGLEQAVYDNLHFRLESTSYGQIPGLSTGTFYGGFTALEFGASLLWYLDEDNARHGNQVSWFQHGGTDFEGLFAGLAYGGIINPGYSIFVPDDLKGAHMSHFASDLIAGRNWALNDFVRVGVEAQGGLHYDTSGTINFQGQALAKTGLVFLDGAMVYASGGVGLINGSPVYSAGGGLELAWWGDNTARLDVHKIGRITSGGPEAPSALKFTFGALWYAD